MCGIIGYINVNGLNKINTAKLDEGLSRLKHRGPDGGATYSDNNVFLGHRRLSIIDLSNEADQPFKSSNEDVYVTFNGEIYNYKELSYGLTLRTSSDTEVLLEGYIKYGVEFFKKIRGIYAFAIYDKREKNHSKILLLRDPGGIKPLYYSKLSDFFSFSSEIKGLLPINKDYLTINEGSIKLFIHLGYIPEPSTIYNEILAFKPGFLYTVFCEDLSISSECLIGYDFYKSNTLSESENLSETRRLLKNATGRNLVADVEVNVALSGGIDSSLIYAYSNEKEAIKGITVEFDEDIYNEVEVAKVYARHLNAPHSVINTHVENKIDLLDTLLLHFDQPYADSSLIPFYFLTKAASSYSKVLIGGDSGDELHNGYSGFRVLPYILTLNSNIFYKKISILLLKVLKKILKRNQKRAIQKLINLVESKNINETLFNWNSWFPVAKSSYPVWPFKYNVDQIYKDFSFNNNDVSSHHAIVENYFSKRMLSDYLRKSEMMSMYNSLEFRVPMLDEDFVQFSLTIPYNQKSSGKNQKILLRKLHAEVYPQETSKLKKKGFSIPLDNWLGKENLSYIKNYLKDKNGIVVKYINLEYIDVLFETLNNNKLHEYCSRETAYERILILYSLQLWSNNLNASR